MTLVKGFDTPTTAWDQDTSWQLNITATDPVPGDPEMGVTFMAPTSGRVLVIIGGGGRDNGGANRILMKPEVYAGTQAIPENIVDNGDFKDFTIPGEADEGLYGSRVSVLENLVPFRVHYARVVHAVTGGTSCDIFVREILVAPLP